jgi:ubiquinol-cytochrome c reductase iron-sulfur subunit
VTTDALPSVTALSEADRQRRALLLHTAQVVGGVGVLAAAVPFVQSFEPSARARAEGEPVTASWAALQPGELQTVAWRGKPVWLMRRSPEMIAALSQPNPELADADSLRSEQPQACRNASRSLTPELLVAVGICTHLGCSPTLHLGDSSFDSSIHSLGGFLCPCHGSRFDLAGRVVRNVPAPTNLEIPPHVLQDGQRVLIG